MDIVEALEYIKVHKIIPVIRLSKEHNAKKLIYALIEGGLRVIEVSLLSYNALEIIATLRRDGIFVGAGTVMNSTFAQAAIDKGAYFVVSPHTDRGIIKTSDENNVLAVPGCLTPNEVVNASKYGTGLIKIFPACGTKGLAHLKSLVDVFPNISFMPTGGINLGNIEEYLSLGVFALGISSSITPRAMINAKDYKALSKLATEYVQKVQSY